MRKLRALIIALVVLAALFVIADRVSLRFAQNEVRDQVLRNANWTGGHTTVHIGGFPFLTQVLRGNYEDVQMRAEGVTIDDVPDITLQVTLHGVHLPLSDLRSRDVSSVPVDQLNGSAEVTYEAVAGRIAEAGKQLGITSADLSSSNGTLQLAVQLELLGQRLSGVATGTLGVSDGKLRITATGLDVGGAVPPAMTDAAVAALNVALTNVSVLPTLPYGLTLTSVSLTSDGIVAQAAAADVTV